MEYRVYSENRPDRFRPKAEQYSSYQRDGFLVVPQLVGRDEVEDMRNHAMSIFRGTVEVPGLDPPPPNATDAELIERFSRVHMLHRADRLSEVYMLHPRVLDVVEALIGPDVLALQTMLFFNPPGKGGQGYHQDSYYIKTYPDTLVGAWISLDVADEETGCLWVAPGSNVEPIYPSPDPDIGWVHADGALDGVSPVENVSHLDDGLNTLSSVVRTYDIVPVPTEPGDVVFFQGHLLHRSWGNTSKDRWRRAFVSHYCNARSWVPWNFGHEFHGDCGNHEHILARGTTHLPFAQPAFGTRCAATDPPVVKRAPSMKPKSAQPMPPPRLPRS